MRDLITLRTACVIALLVPGLFLASVAAAQDAAHQPAAVEMAPMTVKAGPLALIGIRCGATLGAWGMVSTGAHIKQLVIVEVFKDSAAERSGLAVNDRILQIAGIPITRYSIRTLRGINTLEKGDKVELQILGPDAAIPHTVEVTLGAAKPGSS